MCCDHTFSGTIRRIPDPDSSLDIPRRQQSIVVPNGYGFYRLSMIPKLQNGATGRVPDAGRHVIRKRRRPLTTGSAHDTSYRRGMSWHSGRRNGWLPQAYSAVFARGGKLLSISEDRSVCHGTFVPRHSSNNRPIIEIDQSRFSVIGAHHHESIVRSQSQIAQRDFWLCKLTHHLTGLKIHEPD